MVDPSRTIGIRRYGRYYPKDWVDYTAPVVYSGIMGGSYEKLQTVDRRGEPAFRRMKKFIRDNGGPFRVDRVKVERTSCSIAMDARPEMSYGYKWEGSAVLGDFLTQPSLGLTGQWLKERVSLYSPFSNDLPTFAEKALNRLSPLKSGANAGQALSELMFDGLPSLPLKLFARHKALRAAGSEYLNVMFGWKPFLNDLRQLYDTWESLDKRLTQIYRDNGRPVRRRVVLRNDIGSSITDGGLYGTTYPSISQPTESFTTPPVYGVTNPIWKKYKTVQTLDKIWASGQFRYNIPNLSDDRWTDKAKLALFGLEPTPALLWEVMPWSWLIDWFSNVGDVLAYQAGSGYATLLIDYCYLMRHQRKVSTWSSRVASQWCTGLPLSGPARYAHTTPASLQVIMTEERKERVAATPFGFNLRLTDLSVSQLAILTALGLSRQNFT